MFGRKARLNCKSKVTHESLRMLFGKCLAISAAKLDWKSPVSQVKYQVLRFPEGRVHDQYNSIPANAACRVAQFQEDIWIWKLLSLRPRLACV